MKNTFLLLILLFSFGVAEAQISLEYLFPTPNTSNGPLSVVKFNSLGEKYVLTDLQQATIQVYSMSQVLEKTITVPAAVTSNAYSVYYISDNLFDLDSSIEYLVNQPVNNTMITNTYIVKEDGSILLTVDSAYHSNYQNPNLVSDFADVYPTTTGTKLILKKQNYGFYVYSLPGSLPCFECSSGVYTGNAPVINPNHGNSALSNPYPNPTNNLTRIDYKLPPGIHEGELVFYNTVGVEVKRFKVTSTFSFIYVSAHDLVSGTYYYTLQTSEGGSDGKKMVVIR